MESFWAAAPGARVPTRRERPLRMRLRESRERFRSLFDRNPDAVVLCDVGGHVVRSNEVARTLAGFAARTLERVHFSALVAPQSLAEAQRNFARALAGHGAEFETQMRHADGTLIDLMVTLCPVVVDGRVTAISAVCKDITALKTAELAFARSEQRFRSIFEHHPDGVAAIDADGRYVRVNAALERLSGYRGEQLVGGGIERLVAPEALPHVRANLARAAAGESPEYISTIVRSDGTRRHVQVKAVPIVVDGIVEGVHAFIRDVHEQHELERLAREQSERIRQLYVLAATPTSSAGEQIDRTLAFGARSLEMRAAYVLRIDGQTVVVCNAIEGAGLAAGTHLPLGETICRKAYGSREPLAVSDASHDPWREDPSQAHMPWGAYLGTTIVVNGAPWGVLSFVGSRPRQAFTETDADFVQLMAALVGTSIEREEQHSKLGQLAFYDPLTALPNRALLGEQLATALARARRQDSRIAVHFVDLDGFKAVNDGFGHAWGDELLRMVGARLKDTLRESDTVARVGGDEFVVVQPDLPDGTAARGLAQRLLDVLAAPFTIAQAQVRVGASIGISLYPDHADDVRGLLRCADAALYRVKHAGKNALAFYA